MAASAEARVYSTGQTNLTSGKASLLGRNAMVGRQVHMPNWGEDETTSSVVVLRSAMIVERIRLGCPHRGPTIESIDCLCSRFGFIPRVWRAGFRQLLP